MAIQDLCWWGFYWLHGVGFWVDLCICIWLPAMSLYWYRGFVSGLVNCLLWAGFFNLPCAYVFGLIWLVSCEWISWLIQVLLPIPYSNSISTL